jgi:hypothetical protein
MPNLRRAQEEDGFAVFAGGEYSGNSDEAKELAKGIIGCFEGLSSNHPCLGDTATMELTLTL